MQKKEQCKYGLYDEWGSVIGSIEKIGKLYSRVNRVISLGLADKLRILGVKKIGYEGNYLDAGSGPGDLMKIIREVHPNSYIVGLDASYCLVKIGLKKLSEKDRGYIDIVIGLFEDPPFRENVFNGIFSAYAIRDSINLLKAIKKLSNTVLEDGFLINIDVGKPSSRIIESMLILYMKTIVPFLSTLYFKNRDSPWKKIVETIERIPNNDFLEYILRYFYKIIRIEKYAFGAMIISFSYMKKSPSPSKSSD